MPRVVLVDDSQTVRDMLSARLRERGYEVEVAADGVRGAEIALANPPNVVLTDLWMPGISGVQLCRLLRAEAATKHVPVVLLSAEAGRRARFWARSAGAAKYVLKTDINALFEALAEVLKTSQTFPPSSDAVADHGTGTIHERLSHRLDVALFESVVAGEVRALAQTDGNLEKLFAGLVDLASEIASYRWLALTTDAGGFFLHTHPDARASAEAEARAALGVTTGSVVAVVDDRAITGRSTETLIEPVVLGPMLLGTLAMSASPRGASRDDRTLVKMLAAELGGPLRIGVLIEQTRQVAMTDALTGVMNRRAFLEAMGRERSRAKRFGHTLSILLLDLDHFKQVNDTRGHGAGDAVLKGLAGVLGKMARKADLVARWGGEEFVVGLPETAEGGARVAAERLRRAIAEARYPLPGGEAINATASIGMATLQAEESVEQLIARADQAMYLAKSRGRNRVEGADAKERAVATTQRAPAARGRVG